MSRRFLAALPLAFAASTAAAQATPPATPEKRMTQAEATVSTLTKLEESWTAALIRRDRSTFERVLAPKFIYSEDGRTFNRADFIRETLAPGETVTEAHADSIEVHTFGNTGITVGWRTVKGRGKDGPFERLYRFTDTWMPRSGSWQIVAGHASLVPKR